MVWMLQDILKKKNYLYRNIQGYRVERRPQSVVDRHEISVGLMVSVYFDLAWCTQYWIFMVLPSELRPINLFFCPMNITGEA